MNDRLPEYQRRLAALSPEQRKQLIAKLQQSRGVSGDGGPPRPAPARSGPVPLSFAQQRLWFFEQMRTDGADPYNELGCVSIEGALDVQDLRRSLDEVVQRHEALRTTFVSQDGVPQQRVREARPVELCEADLRTLPEGERQAQLHCFARELARQPFDLTVGPLFRVLLVRCGPESHVLMLAVHHIVFDRWSAEILSGELSALYSALRAGHCATLPDLPAQYADYAILQRNRLAGDELQRQRHEWSARLKGAPAFLPLPTDRPRPDVQTFNGARKAFALDRDLVPALSRLNAAAGTTHSMSLLAAFAGLLHLYTDQTDILIGTTVADRDQPQFQGLIGLFVNLLPLRIDLSGRPTFRQLQERVRRISLEAIDRRETPFETLVEIVQPQRTLRHAPLFQVLFVFNQAAARPPQVSDGLKFKSLDIDPGTAKFDLTLYVDLADDQFTAAVEYNTDLFDAETIDALANHLCRLLERAVADPDRALADLQTLSDSQRQHLIAKSMGGRPANLPRPKNGHGELESILTQHSNVRSAVVLDDVGTAAGQHFTAWIVPAGLPPTSGELTQFLQQQWPGQVAPATYRIVGQLPTAGGQIDRAALRKLGTVAAPHRDYAPPVGPIESKLAQIWCELLKVDRVGRFDNFFESGGHSLLAVQVLARVDERFGAQLPLQNFFDGGTVASLAEELARLKAAQVATAELRSRIDQLSAAEVRLQLANKRREKAALH